jgi:hypothetical protein
MYTSLKKLYIQSRIITKEYISGIMEIKHNSCKNCKHWQPWKKSERGNCIKLINTDLICFDFDYQTTSSVESLDTHMNFGCNQYKQIECTIEMQKKGNIE